MSRPSFLRVGDATVNVDQIAWAHDRINHMAVWFAYDMQEPVILPITLDEFERILRDAGREVATVDGAV